MLTDVQARKAKPADKAYSLRMPEVITSMSRRPAENSALSVQFRGKEKLLSLGAYPDVSLAEAREARDTAKGELRGGHDPSFVTKQKKLTTNQQDKETVEAVARDWHPEGPLLGRQARGRRPDQP